MLNPIEPVGQARQPGSITNAQPGNIGMLSEVDGIPCTGAQTSIASSPWVETGSGPESPIEEIHRSANLRRRDIRAIKARFSWYFKPAAIDSTTRQAVVA